jgi:large conductance mechanosensitive channel
MLLDKCSIFLVPEIKYQLCLKKFMVSKQGKKVAGFATDFRDFIMRGNVVDLAVAVVIGGAFGRIVDSFVGDIITPVILNPALQAAQVDDLQNLSFNGIKYGVFLSSVISFVVIAFTIFLIVRSFESLKRKLVRQAEIATVEEEPIPDPVLESQENLTKAIIHLTQVMESK